ncbi:MAG: VCBS repeat-containing protein [Gemmatimonadetes bacterium]|nr:VCBS repeat-containing protein [Gemmatimonadota bacterium]
MSPRRFSRAASGLVPAVLVGLVAPSAFAQLAVTGTIPASHSLAPVVTPIAVTFDRALDPATVTPATFRVFGRWSGPAQGTFALSNGDRTVTFTSSTPFSAGEPVFVNISHDVRGADTTPLRDAGWFFSFKTAVAPSGGIHFNEIDVMSNLGGDPQTRIYGAAACDLDNDGYLDLATVNETSADVRVTLNRADGSGLFEPFLPANPIGVEASPNEPADFDGDFEIDLCVAASLTEEMWILLGNGDGTFGSTTGIPVGSVPHGVAVLDADGDGDTDIVNANQVSGNLSLLLNDGTGTFAAPVYFDGGVSGEYGLTSGDLNEDGIEDLVVAGQAGQEIVTLLGNGDATFTPAASPSGTGGWTWVVALDDLNGDGHLDAACANSFSNHVSVLFGNGDGTFGSPQTYPTGAHTPAVDLGDLDGDGDADLIASSFGGGFWRFYENDGTGTFSFVQDVIAPSNPSCAIFFDSDNDLDLDLALSDEIADVLVLLENVGDPTTVIASGALTTQAPAPNPFRESTRLRVFLDTTTAPRLELVGVRGRRVAVHEYGVLGAGWRELEIPARDDRREALAPGVYFYRVSAGGRDASGRVVRVD